MKLFNFLTAVATTAASENPELVFQPENFLGHLKNMGLGMLIIFVVIGIIILVTLMINKLFAE